jgi:hypothetical protein
MDQNELSLEPRYLRVPSDLIEMISEPIVRLVQIMHLSSIDTNTMSKWTETRFDKTNVT